jgi:O-antigen ligase
MPHKRKPRTVHRKFDVWTWYAVALAFAITTSVALTSILSGIALLWTFFHWSEWRQAMRANMGHPVFRAILVFLLILLAGVPIALVHGYSPWETLAKHTSFILFFCLVGLLHRPQRRRGLLLGFGIGMGLAMLLSEAAAVLGVPILHADPAVELSPILSHTDHNIFLGLAAFALSSFLFKTEQSNAAKWLGWGLVSLASIDILLLVHGRGGQIAFIALVLFFLATMLRSWTQKVLLASLFLCIVGAIALYGDSALNIGLRQADKDIASYQKGHTQTSVGFRIQFVKSTLTYILDRQPILGGGTGSFKEGYAEYQKLHPGMAPPFAQPHNDYLFYWAENGLPGLFGLIGIYASMFYFGRRRRNLQGLWLAALALAWSITGLAGAMMLDHSSSFAFAVLLSVLLAGDLPFSVSGCRDKQRPVIFNGPNAQPFKANGTQTANE